MIKENYIFGIRAVIEAIRSGKTTEKILIKKGLDNDLFQELFQLIRSEKIFFQFVPIEKLNRITRKNHQGVIAFIPSVEFHSIEVLLPSIFEAGSIPLILILDRITDVRNFGAIVRSAECAGVHAVIIPGKGSASINADAIKTSAGALHHLPVCRSDNLQRTVLFLKESGIHIIAASEKTEKLYTTAQLEIPVAIVLGSEDEGISPGLINLADEVVKIPIFGKIESLNVSVASSILVYEAVRQRSMV